MPCKNKVYIASADDLLQDNQLERTKPVVLETVLEVEPVESPSRRASSSCYDLPVHTSEGSPPTSEPTSRPSSVWEILDELRGARSADDASRVDYDFGVKSSTTGACHSKELIGPVPLISSSGCAVPERHGSVYEPATMNCDVSHVYTPIEFPEDVPEVEECSSDSGIQSAGNVLSALHQPPGPASELLSLLGKSRAARNQVNDLASQFSLTLVGGKLADAAPLDRVDPEASFHYSETGGGFDTTGGPPDDVTGPAPERYHQTSSVYSSVRSSQILSPSLTFSPALTGYMSPAHLGQPSTPMIDEFEESLFDLKLDSFLARCDEQPEIETATPHANHNGFPGYTLPEVEYKSALTLHNLQATTPKDSPSKKKSSHDLVSSWNDGSAAQETGLEELLNELSYLGEVIV